MNRSKNNIGIIVAGGPAPGINAVISAVTIEANNRGKKVIGIIDGFKWISMGDISKTKVLSIDNTSRIHTFGGSIIGISRRSPLESETTLKNTISSLNKLGIKYLITIGGDGTMFLAKTLQDYTKGKIKIAHIPKTIDNNILLPDNIPTFGFETAMDIGAKIINNIMEEAKTTKRWFIVITMGRRTGHLALGIAKAAGATLAVIPEEFKGKNVPLKKLISRLEGSVIKRLNTGREYGVAVIAEGMLDIINPEELGIMDKDPMGRIRYIDVNFGQLIKNTLNKSLKDKGVDIETVHKRIGYELRSAAPIPFDLKYTRDLGYCAVKFLMNGGQGALICIKKGAMHSIDFNKLINKRTGKIKVRYVNTKNESYEVAQKYMIKITKSDLESSKTLRELSGLTNLSIREFKEYFYNAVD
ncbi:MAG: 6-phosphofructokinase [Candidatus Dadabacteria bacterium]|nr:6-phosphofructokinase [Candidatus Dadabacteria bacterium]NIQ15794.1 6-phosphofructokinase [Candidatus Dadabacteria bacterium]